MDLHRYLTILLQWFSSLLMCGFAKVRGVFAATNPWMVMPTDLGKGACQSESEDWKTNPALRTFPCVGGGGNMVTVQTRTHAFSVDLGRLSDSCEYFGALSRSGMRETSESLIHLEHISSSVFYNLLEFIFAGLFRVPQDQLGEHIQVGRYLMAEGFLSQCLSALANALTPENCQFYLSLAQSICCVEIQMTVYTYLSRHLLELSHLTRCMSSGEKDELVRLRSRGDRCLCSLRKENLSSWKDPETELVRHLFSLEGSEFHGAWHRVTELPFQADKWCFTAVVLFNYLYLIGGYRQRTQRGWEFKMASYRYNPLTDTWAPTARLIKHRRHFSAVACDGSIYAVGGWYLDSLVTPDSSTALYTAVECYNPWMDEWRLVSSLPLSDFQFTMSLSHDVPLATSLRGCVYVLGNIQRTGEKLVLQYDTRHDTWFELLPTLTRVEADIPSLYFLGATDKLFLIGGNNSENVVVTFCVKSRKWGQVHSAEKVALAGQGTVLDSQVFMPGIEHNAAVRLDLGTLSLDVLPPLPVSMCYDALFHLHFLL